MTTPSKTPQNALGGDLPPSPRAYPHPGAETSTQELLGASEATTSDTGGLRVFVASYLPQYEAGWFLGVFSSEELAQKAVDKKSSEGYYKGDFEIYGWEVDSECR